VSILAAFSFEFAVKDTESADARGFSRSRSIFVAADVFLMKALENA